MNIIGSPISWKPLFPEQFIPNILKGVKHAWRRIQKLKIDELEPRITRKLRHELRQEQLIRSIPIRVTRELTIDDPMTGEESGRIDLCLLYGNIEDVYFAFECKRLNVNFPSGKKSLANEYVGNDGMGCFLSGKYSKGHEHAGMIGYVMDGDVSSATEAISFRLKAKWEVLFMTDNCGLSESSIIPNDTQIKQTLHYLSTGVLALHHVFLPIK